jgi:AcrR family transcriptional regulator
MVGKRLPRAEKQAQTRGELIESGARVFARRGFHAATVEEIAEEAGYSHGAVYSNFAGKEDLFLAVYEQRVASRVREVAGIIADTSIPMPERGRAAGDQWMERFASDVDGFLLNLEFGTYAVRNADLRREYGARVAAMRIALARFLEQDAAAGNIALPMPAEKLALVIRALGLGLAFEKLSDPEGVPDEVFGEFLALLFQLLAPAGAHEQLTRKTAKIKRGGRNGRS